MLIKCLETKAGSPDGIKVFLYEKGNTYSQFTDPPMSESLQSVFLNEGWGKETKNKGSSPENKMLKESPENKMNGNSTKKGSSRAPAKRPRL